MDAYLASTELSKSNSLYLNLNFEILRGCQYSCKGCNVNKQSAEQIDDISYHNLYNLMESYDKELTYVPFIAFIGPTDFLTAENTIDVLSEPRMVNILSRFKRLSFQTTLLNLERAKEFSKVLDTYYPKHELEINVLVEPEKILNKHYLGFLQKQQKEFFDILNWSTPIRYFAIMNVYNYDEAKNTAIRQVLQNYEEVHDLVKDMFQTTIDFNFSLGRKDAALSSTDFIDAATRVKNLFNASITDNTKQFLRFSFGKLNDSLIERQYTWRNGVFYYSPLLYERYVSFIDALKVPLKEYTVAEIEACEDNIITEQYSKLENKKECSICQFQATCIDRGVLRLMDIYGVTDCLVAKDAMIKINTVS